MREMEIVLGGRTLRLVATFQASHDIAKMVGDPLTIVREASLEAMFLNQGIPYEPKWKFTIFNVVQILSIGLRAAKMEMPIEELQNLVFEAGFVESKEAASEYLAMIVGPKPTEVTEKGADSGN